MDRGPRRTTAMTWMTRLANLLPLAVVMVVPAALTGTIGSGTPLT